MKKELTQQVKSKLDFESRKRFLMNMDEIKFQKHFKELLSQLYPNDLIEITQGSEEYGKDIIRINMDILKPQAYGYVIKMGNISGKINSDIKAIKDNINFKLDSKSKKRYEEIKEQIEQSKYHEVNSKNIYQKLLINHIVVVLVGEMSKNAQKRMEQEIENVYQGMVSFIDIHELVNLFTEHYPEVFFENEVLKDIQEFLKQIEANHYLGKSGGMSLDDYFIEPRFSYYNIDELSKQIKRNDNISLKDVINKLKELKFGYSHIFNFIKEKQHILFSGGRGTGKTTLLLKINQDLLKKYINSALKNPELIEEGELPIYIKAKELLDDSITGKNIVSKFYKKDFKINVLLVDGLDEVPKDKINHLVSKAQDIAFSLNSALILTSRELKKGDTIGNNIKKYKLLELEFSQAIGLIEKILKTKRQVDFANVFEKIKTDLKKLEHQIPMFPLSLIMMMEILEKNNYEELPSSITDIYDRYMETILGKWDKEKGLDIFYSYKIKESFLEELAYYKFFKENKISILKEEFENFLQDYISKHNEIKDIKIFREEILNSNLIKENKGEIEFTHKSFLDYFSAKYLKDLSDEIKDIKDILANAYLDENWEDVTFFFIGLKRKLDEELLEKFIEYYKDDEFYHAWSLFQLGLLLQAGWHTENSIKKTALEYSVEYGISEVRNKLLHEVEKASLPKIVSDILIVEFSKNSYSSNFIASDSVDYIRKLIDKQKIFEAVILLNAVSSYIKKEELENFIEILIEKIKEIENSYNVQKLYTSRIILNNITEKKFPILSKRLKKDLKKFMKKNPDSLIIYMYGKRKNSIKERIKV